MLSKYQMGSRRDYTSFDSASFGKVVDKKINIVDETEYNM
jgi:hypothetical protein